jgi:hypothetical protein
MGRVYETLDDSLRRWIEAQRLFFVATAPDGPGGHLNLSPKGAAGAFRVLGPTTVAYLDLVGSGVETAAHLRQNGRIVLMFCAFEGPPKIVRLHGRGRVVAAPDPEFAGLLAGFPVSAEVQSLARTVVVVEVGRVSDSCGFGVPRMDFVGERDQQVRWAEVQREKRGDGWLADYVRANNAASIDGLTGLDAQGAPPGADEAVSPIDVQPPRE